MDTDRIGRPLAAASPCRFLGDRRVLRALLTVVLVGLGALGAVSGAGAARAHSPGDTDSAVRPGPGAVPAAGADGPVSAADRDLLVKVRLAGLWEMPAGAMAARKGADARVREVGNMISGQHVQLDALVLQAGKDLGVDLPGEPTAEQNRWLAEMDAAAGEPFDHVFVDRLRAAHGKVFPVIAAVRSGTRNSVVRRLAQAANGFVLTHLTLLESTGMVDYAQLPAPPAPPAPTAATAPTALGAGSDRSPLVVLPAALTSLVSSPAGGYAGLILPVAALLILPRLLRTAARRRFDRRATRAAALPVQLQPYPEPYPGLHPDHLPSPYSPPDPHRPYSEELSLSRPGRRLRTNPRP